MADIVVMGAGAVGSVLGGFLAQAGHTVTLLGRPAHMRAIAERGLAITGLFGHHWIRGLEVVTDPAALPRGAAAVWVCVKSYDTASVASWAEHCRAPRGVVISAQNGLGNLELLASTVPPTALLGARVIFGARLVRPGEVEVTVSAEPVRIGAFVRGAQEAERQARHWAEALAAAGLDCQWTPDIHAELWAKVFYNAALNPLGALLGCHYGALAEHDDTRALMDQVIAEAFAVARAEGVALPWSSAEEYLERFYSQLVPATYGHRSSMLQDLERGKPTEIEAINGALWRRATQHGLAAPANELLTRLLRVRSALARKEEGRR